MSAYIQSYDASVLTPEALVKYPDRLREFFPKYLDQNLFATFDLFNMMLPAHSDKVEHQEKGYLYHDAVPVTPSGGGVGGANLTLTIDASAHWADLSGKASPVNKRDFVIVRDQAGKRLLGYIVDKDTTTDNAHTLTFQPTDATADTTAATWGADVFVIHLSNGKSDGSNWLGSQKQDYEFFHNYLQIFSQRFEMDRGAGALASWFADGRAELYNFKVGDETKRYLWITDLEETINRHYMDIQWNSLFQQRDDGSRHSDPETGKPVQLNGGLDWNIEQYGYQQTYATFGLTEIKELSSRISKKLKSRKYMGLLGTNLNQEFDEFMYTIGTDANAIIGATDFAEVSEDKSKLWNLNFYGIKNANVDFCKCEFSPFNYEPITGFEDTVSAQSEPWPENGFWLPYGKTNVRTTLKSQSHTLGTVAQQHVTFRYLDNGGITRGKFNERGKPSYAGGNAQGIDHLKSITEYFERTPKESGFDQLIINMQAHGGIQVVGADALIKSSK